VGLKSVDFYRKLKRDLQSELTEASIAGAALVILRSLLLHFSTLSLHHLIWLQRRGTIMLIFQFAGSTRVLTTVFLTLAVCRCCPFYDRPCDR